MGGGFMFSGNSTSFSAARPPFSAAGTSRSFHTHHHSLAAICTESKLYSQNAGNSVFGSVPSPIEVEKAIGDLQRFMNGVSSTSRSELNGPQGLMSYNHQLQMMQAPGFQRFSNAFNMMQTEPALQNMVVSISCDKAVWEAIMSNKTVLDLQGSISAAKQERLLMKTEEPDIAILIMKWIMGFTKSKVLELVEKLGLLVNEISKPSAPKDKPTSELTDLLEEKVKSSLLLSVVIILVVVLTRNHN